MAENTVILRLNNVSKSFAKVEHDEVTHALNEVNLSMKSGEFISLVGPSGCGKSTILRLVAGLIPPTTGYLTVNGAEIRREEVQDRFKKLNMRHIRYVLNCLNTNDSKIRNIRSYLITCLYNAPVTIDTYYYAQVQRDMYLGKI